MNETACHRVLVVDDHPLFRRGVVQLLNMDPTFQVAAEAGTYEETVAALEAAGDIDLVVLDLNMKGTSGIEILTTIKNRDPSIRVIMLTVSDSPADLVQAFRSGVDGYLLKDQEPEDILRNLRRALDGHTVLSPQLMNALAQSLKEEHESGEGQVQRNLRMLTERELAVLNLIAQGKSNKAIARDLDISDGTVKVHVKHLLRKLRFRSRVEAAVWMSNQSRN